MAEGGAIMGIARKTAPDSNALCACGHIREAHEHYRRGSECSICDIRECSAFTAVSVPEYSKTQ